MNGRIYDPLLGRFLSADTFVQDAGDLQAYNRYSYVRNNPTSLNDPSGHFWSALITVGFAAYDTYNYATGKTTGAEYAKNMALNGAALVADVATVGQGGGLAVRAANAGVRVAKAIDKANDAYETATTLIETGKIVASGDSSEISRAVVTTLVEHVVGGGKGKHDVDLNKNKIHVDADAGKKIDAQKPATHPLDSEAKPYPDVTGKEYKGDLKPEQIVQDHKDARALGGKDEASNIAPESWETNARKAGFEGNLAKDRQAMIDAGMDPADVDKALAPEKKWIMNDAHPVPVDPEKLKKLPQQ